MQQSKRFLSESWALTSPGLIAASATFVNVELLPLPMSMAPFKVDSKSDVRTSERNELRVDLGLPVSKNMAESVEDVVEKEYKIFNIY